MKFSALDFLRCPSCEPRGAAFLRILNRMDIEYLDKASNWSCRNYCSFQNHKKTKGIHSCNECLRVEIISGTLECIRCKRNYTIIDGVPQFFSELLPDNKDSNHNWLVSEMKHHDDSAQEYEDRWVHHPRFEVHYSKAVRNLFSLAEQHGIILDIGCGTGRGSLLMANTSNMVVGIDISSGLLGLAMDKARNAGTLKNTHFIQCNAVRLPLASSYFDLATYWGVLHHLPNRQESLLETKRVLRESGFMSLSEPNGESSSFIWILGNLVNFIPSNISRFRRRKEERVVAITEYEKPLFLNHVLSEIKDSGYEIVAAKIRWFFVIMPLDFPYEMSKRIYRMLSRIDDKIAATINNHRIGGEIFIVAKKN